MNEIKITFENRNTNNWKLNDYSNMNYIELENFVPSNYKLFNGDVFTYNDNKINIIHSTIRNIENISGVLILEGNKIYGKENKKNMYKCLPDDKRIPPFLIPYEFKNIGFSKYQVNKYVNFKFIKWDKEHPIGMLTHTIGDVNKLENFYEYQLYCKSLNASIQNFTRQTKNVLNIKSQQEYFDFIMKNNPQIQNRTENYIFTIDGKNTLDFDDAISIRFEDEVKIISIYISNVSIWLDTLNLWDSFSNRISTIYLPDKKRPMLPTILSDNLCSLKENELRFAFVIDIHIKNDMFIKTEFNNCLIKVAKNYIYDDKKLLNDSNYQKLFETVKSILPNYKYIPSIKNSHDVISYLMIFMNHYSAKHFENYSNGIYRTSVYKKDTTIPEDIPEEIHKFMKIWSASAGQYVKGKSPHEILELDSYIHITSPIRRLVDLLNLISIQKNLSLFTFKNDVDNFYNLWTSKLEYINITMRAIRKVQMDCTMLELCTNNPDIKNTNYQGYLFDKVERDDGLFQYIVYLPELKIVSKITSRENKNNYEKGLFQIYLFEDEEKIKKKIRLHLIK